jgi:hypothetical protein
MEDTVTKIDKTSLDRMADLTRKVLSVKKTALPKVKRKKRKKH